MFLKFKVLILDCEIRVFGSRVHGKAKNYSDLDIALCALEVISNDVIFALKEDFQESDLPWRVDLIDWNTLTDSFKNAILNRGYEVLKSE